jgi:hypothetical protein
MLPPSLREKCVTLFTPENGDSMFLKMSETQYQHQKSGSTLTINHCVTLKLVINRKNGAFSYVVLGYN